MEALYHCAADRVCRLLSRCIRSDRRFGLPFFLELTDFCVGIIYFLIVEQQGLKRDMKALSNCEPKENFSLRNRRLHPHVTFGKPLSILLQLIDHVRCQIIF